MDNLEIAKALFGGSGSGSGTGSKSGGQTTTAYGIATGDSENGIVRVNLGGDTVSQDDDQTLEVETTFAVFEGDEVIVSLVGADGTGKAPCVIGVVGRGDQQQTEINSVINYVWNDEHGLHVSTAERSVQGANILLDSDSLDIRYGTTNSENDQTIYASFGREVTVGSRASGSTVGNYSQVFGTECIASGSYSHAEGYQTTASGAYSHAEGWGTSATGQFSHADGSRTEASEQFAHAEGSGSIASGKASHAEGSACTASAEFSHAEGGSSKAYGRYSHAEGYNAKADDSCDHAEGCFTIASGTYSHAEGHLTTASGGKSHAEGYYTQANSTYQHVQGKFNVLDSSDIYADIIGNGTGTGARSNAYNMDWNGNAEFQGEVYVGGCTPNGETPYPVVRYNTSNSKQEYYDKANSTWAQVPGGGGGGGSSWTELWTNPNPTSNFAAQTVPLDLSAWSMLAIVVTFNTSSDGESICLARVGNKAVMNAPNLGSTMYNARRLVDVQTTGLEFGLGYRNTTGTAGAQYCVPQKIYGVC